MAILQRPLALLRAKTALPPLVLILVLKPETRRRLRLCGLICVRIINTSNTMSLDSNHPVTIMSIKKGFGFVDINHFLLENQRVKKYDWRVQWRG